MTIVVIILTIILMMVTDVIPIINLTVIKARLRGHP